MSFNDLAQTPTHITQAGAANERCAAAWQSWDSQFDGFREFLTVHAFQNKLIAYGTKSSMSREGIIWGNAATKNLWGSVKVDKLYGMRI